jgi:CHAT domain-containing protein
LSLAETVRERAGSQQLRSSYLASRENIYEFYIDLLMQQHKANPTAGFDAEAFKASERGRARSLMEMLAESRIAIRRGVSRNLVERERILSDLLNAKAQRHIQLLSQKGSADELAILTREISALEDEYQQLQATIRMNSPAYAALTQPQPLGLKEVQQQLDPKTLLLEYSLGDKRSYLWAVNANSLKSFELPGRELIQKSARKAYDLLTARSQIKPKETAAEKRGRVRAADLELERALPELAKLVLGPAEAELPGKRVVVVADDALQYVPFAALSLRIHQPLITDHEVITLPSASALAIQRQNLANRKPAINAIAVIADPVFSIADDRLQANGHSKSQDRALADEGDNTRIIEHIADDASGQLAIQRLRFTRQEAEQILAVAPRRSNLQALDFEANRAIATSGDLSRYRYVHFATHGYIDSERPDLSAVVLSLVDKNGDPQDGFLRAHDIYNLNLPAELVVLSACQTGLGKEVKGEGLVGLTRGFMYAGARRLVVSLWNVNDKATAELMRRFYRGMLLQKLTPAAALRQAQTQMSHHPRWSSPYYWAAFVLQGEWK